MRGIAAALAGCLVCWGQPPEPPTFRSTTTLIEFTITALDSKGRPVTDLKKEEISITENGQPRDVAVFRFEGGPGNELRLARLPAGIFTNRSERAPGPPRNLTALVLDAINVSPNGQLSIQAQLMRYMKELPPNARVAMYRLGNQVTVLQDLTDDIGALRAQIAKLDVTLRPELASAGIRPPGALDLGLGPRGASGAKSRADMAKAEADALSVYNTDLLETRVTMTLAGLEALGDHLAAIPGRKSLVWISSGVPILTRAAGSLKSYEQRIRKTAERLASQGIAIYPATDPRTQSGALDILAEITGGRVVKSINDPAQGVTAAAADMRGAYSLGFYAIDEPDNTWRRLDVKVQRHSVRLSHRKGYLSRVAALQPQDWSEDQWSAAVYNPLGSTNLRVDASCEIISNAGSRTLRVVLYVAAADLAFRRLGNELGADIEVAIAEKSADGKFRIRKENSSIRFPDARAAEAATSLARYTQNWQIGPDTSTIRLIARDRFTGRYGTLDVPVNSVPLRAPAGQARPLPVAPQPISPAAAGGGHDPFIERARATVTSFLLSR
jgi:VWFA-related protein